MRLHMHLRIHELAANLAQGAVVLRRPCIRRTDAVPQVFLTGRHVDAVPERRRPLLRSWRARSAADGIAKHPTPARLTREQGLGLKPKSRLGYRSQPREQRLQ